VAWAPPPRRIILDCYKARASAPPDFPALPHRRHDDRVQRGAFPALLPEMGAAAELADWQLGAVAGAFGLARMVSKVPVGLFITHHVARALTFSPGLMLVGRRNTPRVRSQARRQGIDPAVRSRSWRWRQGPRRQ
jgi:hypothetical protein